MALDHQSQTTGSQLDSSQTDTQQHNLVLDAEAVAIAIRDLLKQKERYKAILENVVDSIITINGKGVIEEFSHSAERMFGYPADEVLGKNVNLLMPSPFREEHDGYLANYLKTGKKNIIGIGREVVGKRKNGTTFPIHLSVSEVIVSDVFKTLNKDILFTGIVRDLTEQKRQEEEAAQRSRELQIAAEHNFEGQIEAISKSQMVIEFDIDGCAAELQISGFAVLRTEGLMKVKSRANVKSAFGPGSNPSRSGTTRRRLTFLSCDSLQQTDRTRDSTSFLLIC